MKSSLLEGFVNIRLFLLEVIWVDFVYSVLSLRPSNTRINSRQIQSYVKSLLLNTSMPILLVSSSSVLIANNISIGIQWSLFSFTLHRSLLCELITFLCTTKHETQSNGLTTMSYAVLMFRETRFFNQSTFVAICDEVVSQDLNVDLSLFGSYKITFCMAYLCDTIKNCITKEFQTELGNQLGTGGLCKRNTCVRNVIYYYSMLPCVVRTGCSDCVAWYIDFRMPKQEL